VSATASLTMMNIYDDTSFVMAAVDAITPFDLSGALVSYVPGQRRDFAPAGLVA